MKRKAGPTAWLPDFDVLSREVQRKLRLRQSLMKLTVVARYGPHMATTCFAVTDLVQYA